MSTKCKYSFETCIALYFESVTNLPSFTHHLRLVAPSWSLDSHFSLNFYWLISICGHPLSSPCTCPPLKQGSTHLWFLPKSRHSVTKNMWCGFYSGFPKGPEKDIISHSTSKTQRIAGCFPSPSLPIRSQPSAFLSSHTFFRNMAS